MTDLELKLPDSVLEGIPASKPALIQYLSKYFDTVIDEYDNRFQKRVTGTFGAPLSRYEKSVLKDFLIDQTLGKLEESTQVIAAETLTSR